MKQQQGYTAIEFLMAIVLVLFGASVLAGTALALIALAKYALQ